MRAQASSSPPGRFGILQPGSSLRFSGVPAVTYPSFKPQKLAAAQHKTVNIDQLFADFCAIVGEQQ